MNMKNTQKRNLSAFFNPESIVFVGVSLKKITLGRIALLNNVERKFEGRLYGVGTEKGQLEGVEIFTSISELPESPDVAVILTPANTVIDILKECGEKGILNVVIETGGFSEYSTEKNNLENDVLAIAQDFNISLIGPNCVGAANGKTGLMNAFGFFKREEKDSDIGTISQSGGIGNTFIRILNDNHMFWNKFVSIGNKLDLDESDFTKFYLEDDTIGKIIYYLESFKRGRVFFDLAMTSEKPLIILKSNRSTKSASIAQSHTTAISTGDDIVDAALKQSACIRVNDENELTIATKSMMLPLMKNNRVAVLSRSGGHAVITADACEANNFEMIEFPQSFFDTLKSLYTTRVINHQNPLDLGEIFDYTIFTSIVEEALKLDTVDGIIFNHLYQPSYEAESSRQFLDAVKNLVEKYNKPVAVSLTSNAEEIVDISKNHPYPVFTTPNDAAKSLAISLDYYNKKTHRDNRGEINSVICNNGIVETIKNKCSHENRIPLTNEALEIIKAAGLKIIDSITVKDSSQINDKHLTYPVALKVLSRDASHKSDSGGVVLNISNKENLIANIDKMKNNLLKEITIDGYLIQSMAQKGEEFFVGAKNDPVFGPVIITGMGGIFIEIFKDRAIALAPVTENEVNTILKELKSHAILEGARGKEPLDKEALVQCICSISQLIHQNPHIEEIDLNPVIVHEKGMGISIVDARVFFKKE